jgi:hypothetical protein
LVLPQVPNAAHIQSAGGPIRTTLAVADVVKRIWRAWLVGEAERVKRRSHMPAGLAGDAAATLPAGFTQASVVHPLRRRIATVGGAG